MIRVLLVDDHDLVRSGFRMILEGEPGITVVGEADDGRTALEVCERARPDVVLMDVQMPVLDGLEATRRLAAAGEGPAVLILTTFDRDDYLFEALAAGAAGFLLKNAPPEDLVHAVRTLADGDGLLAPAVTRRVITAFATKAPAAGPPPELDRLTDREREVLRELAEGRSNAEIAERIYLGEATVKTHVSNLLAKLGLRDRVQAVVWAHRHGIVADPPTR